GLSVNHFIRTFKRQLNMTPIEYILKLRMAKAKQLLFSSDKIKEIAEQVGYKDEHYFSRVFKKNEGIAPTLYMKNKVNRIATLYYGLDDYVIT
ncbi:helix-turn-helix transcriptional regulator, partial [Bacillus subtilis]